VKVIPDGRGRSRLWYEADEIERITADALKDGHLWPQGEASAINIERFVEVYLQADVDYAGELDRSTLGYTEFKVPPLVVVNRTLTDLAHASTAPLGLLGRWRATLAHEAAHILLHTSLYVTDDESARQRTVRCLRTEVQAGPEARDWREVQANMGMAALLMPKEPFMNRVREILDAQDPVFPPLDPWGPVGHSLTEELATQFCVSRQATRLRLASFGLLARSE
jgi:hypothetical protein